VDEKIEMRVGTVGTCLLNEVEQIRRRVLVAIPPGKN
jgi:hypothetical protein